MKSQFSALTSTKPVVSLKGTRDSGCDLVEFVFDAGSRETSATRTFANFIYKAFASWTNFSEPSITMGTAPRRTTKPASQYITFYALYLFIGVLLRSARRLDGQVAVGTARGL